MPLFHCARILRVGRLTHLSLSNCAFPLPIAPWNCRSGSGNAVVSVHTQHLYRVRNNEILILHGTFSPVQYSTVQQQHSSLPKWLLSNSCYHEQALALVLLLARRRVSRIIRGFLGCIWHIRNVYSW